MSIALAVTILALGAVAVPTSPPTSQLLITSSVSQSECLTSSYYGAYGGSPTSQDHIYLPTAECQESGLLDLDSGSIVPLYEDLDEGRLIWVGQAGIEGGMEDIVEDWAFISERFNAWNNIQGSQQQVFSAPPKISLLHLTDHSLLLHVPNFHLPIIDTFLPSHLVPAALPTEPQPQSINIWPSVPTSLAKNLAKITKHLNFSSEINEIVSSIDLDNIRRNVRYLTGEGPSGIESRHSFTKGALLAAKHIQKTVEETGANCTLHTFLPGFAPNVICHYPSTRNSTGTEMERVILSAHYDSRGSFGLTRAPGGDDDGSGSGHLLGVAQAIGDMGVEFEKSVTLAFFAGEEQGLLGSQAYAKYLHEKNATVILQIQADMLGYHVPGEPMQIGLPESIHLPEASYLIGNLSQLYSPELVVGTTAACCSDHQSFVSYGFPATQVFERAGWIADPQYHQSGDLSQRDGYDFEQIVAIARVTLSALLTVAGYDIGKK